jgi:hypothetical protein
VQVLVFLFVDAFASWCWSRTCCPGRGRGQSFGGGRPRRVRHVGPGDNVSDLEKKGCYWLLTFYYAVLNGALWEDDVAKGHSKADLSEIVSSLSEDVPNKLDYLVIRWEFCKPDDPDTPGRPHAHTYIEFKSRKFGHQVFVVPFQEVYLLSWVYLLKRLLW